jgi:hypothetical protein
MTLVVMALVSFTGPVYANPVYSCKTEQIFQWKNGQIKPKPEMVHGARDVTFTDLGDGTGIFSMVTEGYEGMAGARFRIIQKPAPENGNHLVAVPKDTAAKYANQTTLRLSTVGTDTVSPSFLFYSDSITVNAYSGYCYTEK